MWISRKHYDELLEQIRYAREQTELLQKELVKERGTNRDREERLVDRVLTATGSRPVTPAPVTESADNNYTAPTLPPGFKEDWWQEFAEVQFGLPLVEMLSHQQKQILENAWQAFQNGTFDPNGFRPVIEH